MYVVNLIFRKNKYCTILSTINKKSSYEKVRRSFCNINNNCDNKMKIYIDKFNL